MRAARLLLLGMIALLPSGFKIPLYRGLFGWKIGRNVRIGPSLIDARRVTIGDDVVIGRFNRFQRIPDLTLADKVHIGNRNVFITAPAVAVADVLDAAPALAIGEDTYVVGPHFFDVHAPLRIGRSVTLAGRGSSFYTHGLDYRLNRLVAEPITIGENCYVGAHALFVPGAAVAPNSIVGMGALVTRSFTEEYVLLGGVPARVVQPLDRSAVWFTRPRPGYPQGRSIAELMGEETACMSA
jgi:acetyltransferase-like isoleucine patch superfamily enzyme